MSQTTGIEWTDATWSPIRARVKADAAEIARAKGYTSLVQIAEKMAGRVGPHCEHVSEGCSNCYAETNNHRCLPANGTGLPFDRRSRDLIEPFVDEKILLQPLLWKKPLKIFVENQSDLFGEWVPDEMIDRVFAVMALCPQHTFQVLTKRPERMAKYFSDVPFREKRIGLDAEHISGIDRFRMRPEPWRSERWHRWTLPLPNVWLGVSLEDQKTADERIRWLLETPAKRHFISYEPALGPVDFTRITWEGKYTDVTRGDYDLDWIIVGGESGPGARPFDIQWARNTIAQCRDAGTPCFVKQLGSNSVTPVDGLDPRHTIAYRTIPVTLKDRKGGNWDEWPADLRVREFPEASHA